MPANFDRRVKIVATLGPATTGRENLRALLEAGADVARINAAHGTSDDRARLIEDIRAAADDLGWRVPVLYDLQGLKIRTGQAAEAEGVPIARGSRVEIVNEGVPSTSERIGIAFPDLFDVIRKGSRLLISDGLIELLVERINGNSAQCVVGRGGVLKSRQGVTLPGAQIRGGVLTDADTVDVAFAVQHEVDFLGLSFINDASDLTLARGAASVHSRKTPGMIAKIERPEALENVTEIAKGADGLMVARGDLGVQLPPEKVPRAQKKIIGVANEFGLPVITATQMLESMMHQPVATRAETSDVANAVWDGTDAVMLSGESATGDYPLEAVATMDRIIKEAESEGPIASPQARRKLPDSETTKDDALAFADAIARAALALSEQTPTEHIVVFTLGGSSARRVAKYRPRPPIIAVCSDPRTATRLNLVWGVRSIVVPVEEDPDRMFRVAGQTIIEAGLARDGEYALIVGALPMQRVAGRTNLVHFRRLGS